jgi:RNA polymerase sigma-70 factor (ECF subfamily)
MRPSPVPSAPLPRASAAAEPTVLIRVDDRAALERTLLAILPRVRGWMHRLLGPGAALDDAVQDTLIALAGALPRFAGRSSVETFAHRITLRVAYRYYGRRRKEGIAEADELPSAQPSPEARVASDEVLAKLHRCLDRLPARRRTAFVLCAIEGLSHAEAAALEGVSEGAMRSLYMHARDELARMLATHRTGGAR